MQKNVASQKLIVFAFDATTNLPKTGDAANITAYVSIDYGSVTVLGDTSATEMDATNAKGYYLFDLTQGETNGNTLLFSAKSSTANIVVVGAPASVQTVPASFVVAPGSAGALFIGGTNAATTITTALTTTFTGNLTGSVASVTGAVGSVTGNVGGNIVGSVASVTAGVTVTTNNDKTGYALTAGERNSISDAWTARNVAGGSSTGRTNGQALAFLRNKWTVVGTTLTVYDVDDTSSLWTATVTATAGADPITANDPA